MTTNRRTNRSLEPRRRPSTGLSNGLGFEAEAGMLLSFIESAASNDPTRREFRKLLKSVTDQLHVTDMALYESRRARVGGVRLVATGSADEQGSDWPDQFDGGATVPLAMARGQTLEEPSPNGQILWIPLAPKSAQRVGCLGVLAPRGWKPSVSDNNILRGAASTFRTLLRDRASRLGINRYAEALNAASEAICFVDASQRFLFANASFRRLVGHAPEELVDSSFAGLFVESEKALPESVAEQLKDVDTWRGDSQLLSSDGSVVPVQVIARQLYRYDDFERTAARPNYVWAFTDATAITASQEEVARRSEEIQILARLAQMFEEITDFQQQAMVALTELGEIAEIERLNLRWLDEATGELKLVARVPPSPEGETVERPSHSSGQGLSGTAFSENRTVLTDDFAADPRAQADSIQRGVASVMAVPISDRGRALGTITLSSKEKDYFRGARGPFLETASRAVGALLVHARLREAERERSRQLEDALANLQTAQDQLVQSAKLAALGELLAGVTHELNNPLGSIIGYAELIMTRGNTAQSDQWISTIHNQALHAKSIVADLLTFSRRQDFEKAPISINETILKALEFRDYQLRKNHITVVQQLGKRLPSILGDARRLQQVFLNLIGNAEHAMSKARGSGTLTIATQRIAGKIRVTIADDGPGISQANLDRLFQPFFTTKPAGEGTGLGLSVSYGIIRDHDGAIWAESKPGTGATFIIELPLKKPA